MLRESLREFDPATFTAAFARGSDRTVLRNETTCLSGIGHRFHLIAAPASSHQLRTRNSELGTPKLFVPQRNQRIDFGGPPRRQVAGQQRDAGQQKNNRPQGKRIGRADAEQQAL